MKKIILLMLMLSPFANADMDSVCNIPLRSYDPLQKIDVEYIEKQIQELKCERNNILEFDVDELSNSDPIVLRNMKKLSNLFCRFDRNRLITKQGLSCVLYDEEARRYKDDYAGLPNTRKRSSSDYSPDNPILD